MNAKIERKIFLDTETTGMNSYGYPYEGHNIIEIGAVEMIDRELTGNVFHTYINPQRSVDLKAFEIHKISDDFLKDKPLFSEIVDDFINFIDGTELIIHNASFDVGFINYELLKIGYNFCKISEICKITDSLSMARKIFPGKKNSLDALCDRYHIDRSIRRSHGALIDAKILAEVYKLMTGGQIHFDFSIKMKEKKYRFDKSQEESKRIGKSFVLYANSEENCSHELILDSIEKKIGRKPLWRQR
ncbi:DNA polymerase III subunit epsilon [Candidatus Riesia pediculischaeffi]|uniref:DNA polymerase III subunit epsilon n=2 Tax=Candidatus Riesia pediculischaeffi TaxID=428411 RepID=A0A1V0HKL2_9ENTR|nr:DNA polymerase III subunit epsilon [Candidatus Riesia pediculischaeffi]ARC53365.1 DNA polymerase III subunit epsilon [Candidatus Riesia pediculischaeffi]KIE63853.1 DNA polymerase III epsilon subunit [Candidatus Riesia pediculischaeffi PTSU]